MGGTEFRGRNIGDLNGSVQIGSFHYYFGGITLNDSGHFTGIILLPHQGRTLIYCNSEGIRVLDDNEEDPDYTENLLSLVFLFRLM